ncbi:hypothetical protein DFH08DRAFT_814515 [Mycena albidolilacea]|uniref:Uncharacterized protein n=1 Tax=Mycena albidolilacea TaxID=1033008 RepID=A0AAD7EKM0_9AGAR|nr:hypothetical protein DFH08DRAFT_814515 [Mycena albidolilacea]
MEQNIEDMIQALDMVTVQSADLPSALAISVTYTNIEWQKGEYSGQQHAYESRRLSRISADLFREARALRTEAMCWNNLGNFEHTISLCKPRFTSKKSEYLEAREINNTPLQKFSFEQEPFDHALAVFNLAELEVQIGGPKEVVQRNIDVAKSMFDTMGYSRGFGKDGEIMSYCLERLANPRCWTATKSSYTWTAAFLAHVLQSQEKLGLFKALQFWGDFFLNHGETESAANLYTVALEGFTQLDIHRRGECLLGLVEISQCHGDLTDGQSIV